MAKHIHADLMMAYAKLAQETDTPWEYFEVNYGGNDWQALTCECGFDHVFGYRLKPRTIRIGLIDVPEPVREPLGYDAKYYIPRIDRTIDMYEMFEWDDADYDNEMLARRLIHLDRESAKIHAKALIALTQK
ncbi:hypothetical protein [Xenorhabdus miraniensis]|uniref:Uncharacterized protein n=1 Tax=Xenorhabdus miraniensis TaxID=351674 RepID=A0A2D0JK89_9GAMM|nr:hypothetical protein [Xenorhabdus miraniensis]PHM46559.1 hypothetical protein Xmir_04124 [Xenorhabdus miraniensis]